ncbi:MAG: PAAR domain-containing protein [Thermoanaerobaculia bacterium]|nr:PAAR domain-containing protein [Thermoanaerobaculia bacterium]
MPPALAARRTDATTHGGVVTAGSRTVRIGGQPAARIDDPHTCPLTTEAGTPHLGGVVTEGSRTVRIERKAAARMGDSCDCNTVGVAGAGVPGQIEPFDSDRDDDGTADSFQSSGAVVQGSRSNEWSPFGVPVSISGDLRGPYYEVDGHAHGDSSGMPGGSVEVGGEAGLFRGQMTGQVGPADRPVVAIEGQARGPRVQARGGGQWGDSGRETGAGIEGHATADAFNTQGRLLIDARVARLDLSVDGGLALGAETEQGWSYDQEEQAIHLRTGLAVDPLPGFRIELTIPNPWRDAGAGTNAGIPNEIAAGCPTVRIG